MNLKILYEDNHLIAVDKPAGMLVQRDYRAEDSLLDYTKQYLKDKYNKPGNVYLGLIHRIDRPVSGTVLFARTSKAAGRISEELRRQKVDRFYAALVQKPGQGPVPDNEEWIDIRHNLVRKRDITCVADTRSKNIKDAILRYRVVASDRSAVLLIVQLITGRKHQIRAQLAAIGMPIIGDTKYGSAHTLPDRAICLHSYCIRCTHPTTKEELTVCSGIPERMKTHFSGSKNIDTRLRSMQF